MNTPGDKEEKLQRKFNGQASLSETLAAAHDVASGPGEPLPPVLRAEMGARFGYDFANVRVHGDAAADRAARALRAEAFTAGSGIGFAAGRYRPDSDDGRRLLAHELAHVVQQSSGRGPAGRLDTGPSDPLEREADRSADRALAAATPAWQAPVALSGSAPAPTIQRNEADQKGGNIIRHKGRWGTIDSPALLRLWATEAAMKLLWFGSTVRAIQEDPTNAEKLVESVKPKLHRALHGNQFDGSPEARRDAVEALDMQWETPGQVREPILEQLVEKYTRQAMQALAHTSEGSTLLTAPEEYVRVRKKPYLQKFWNGGSVMKQGYTTGNREVLDIKGWGAEGNPSADPLAEIWYILQRDWNWIYHTTGRVRPFDWHVCRFAAEVADNTQFAAELFPMLLKIGGFALGFSSRFSLIIASEILTALGEQGARSVRGQKMESAFEVLTGVGLGVFIGGVTNRMFGKSGGRLTKELDEAAERAAAKGRAELARTDAAMIERKLTSGEAKAVTDPDLVSEGYRLEVEVVSEGERHMWRQRNGWWCRFSDPVCVPKISDVAEQAAERWRRQLELQSHRRRTDPVWLAKDPESFQNVTSRELDEWADAAFDHAHTPNTKPAKLKRRPEERADLANATLSAEKLALIEKRVAEMKRDGILPQDFHYTPPAAPGFVIPRELWTQVKPIIGLKLNHPAVDAAWREAADAARAGRQLTKANHEEIYKSAAEKFWRIAGRKGSAARAFFEEHGLVLDGKTSAHLPVSGVHRQEASLGLDHMKPKANDENYHYALDGDKLQFLLQADNTKLSHLEKKSPDLRRK